MAKLNVGLIGAGKRSRVHLKFLNGMEEISVAAVADVSEESIAQTCQACKEKPRTTNDYHELLAMKELDAVLITTPNSMHADMAVDALRAGKAVYLEKPMATTVEDCGRIISAVESTGVPLMVGLQLRYSGVFQKVKEVIDSGEIGQVRMLWCKEYRGPFHPGESDWRLSAESSGGSLLEKNCHHYDLFNWFAGSSASRVSGFGGGDVVYKEREIIDNAWTIIEYENRVRASLGLCLFHKKHYDLEIGVIGDNGIIESFFKKGEVTVSTVAQKDKTVYTVPPVTLEGHRGTELPALLAFIETVKKGNVPLDDLRQARDSVAVSLAAEKAIASGQVISLQN